ncbi:hypothetical protein FQN60_009712, partial [Etheostoma spectabile]
RALLVYCLRHYKGDDKIKSFIWDLITPTKEGRDQALLNHSGYERYNAMRADPDLCFLERVGMPDVTALSAEQGGGEGASDMADSVCKTEEAKDESESKADGGEDRDESSKGEETCSSTDTSDKPDSTGPDSQMAGDLCAQDATLVTTTTTGTGTGVASLHVVQARPLWPTGPALTARLRRLITAYQRFTLRREPLLRHDFLLHDGLVGMGMGGAGAAHSHHAAGPLAWQLGDELRRCSVVATEPDPLFLEWQRRWTRREQADFYRTVSSFGVVYDPERKSFDWSQFRALARLERKTDESLEKYFNSFVNMCRTACKLPPRKEEGLVDPAVLVEPLTEERAARTLYRIELLRKIREQVLRHPLLSARLQLCRPSLYLPVWWESGKHDRDLLIGAARHGLSRTDFYILNDPQLSFLEAHRNYVRGHSAHLHPPSHHHPHHPGLVAHSGITSSSSSNPQLPLPHCCLYDSGLGRHSPQPPEYPHQSSHLHPHHQHHSVPPSAPSPSSSSSSHPHLHPLPLDAQNSASPSLGIVPGSRGDFLDCPPLDETLELGALQHDALSADALHGGKASKDALNGFPFNSAAGGQSMLNSYGVGGTDLDLKLRSDVLAPWDGTDHSSPAHHMFNESDPILGPPTLETGFLEDEEAQGGDRGGEEGGTLEECLGLPPSSSPSHPEEPSADQTDLSASPPPPYVPPPPLSLSDITGHEPQDRLDHSDVDESLANPVEGGEGQEVGVGFEFDDKEEEEVEDLSRAAMEHALEKQSDHSLGGEECDQGAAQSLGVMDPPMEVPQLDGIVPEPGHGEQDEPDLQESFDQAEHKEDLPRDVHPYLGKLGQEASLGCPESIEEPGEEVGGLILYHTGEENSLDTETLMGSTAAEDGPAECADLADQVDEISEGQMDHVSLMDVAVLGPHDGTAENQLDVKPNEMVLQSIYSEYTQPSCPAASVSSPTGVSKSDESSTSGSGDAGVKTEVPMDQTNYEGTVKDLNLPDGSRDYKHQVLTFSLHPDNKDNLLEQNEIKIAPTLPANSIDTKPSDLKFSLLSDRGGEKKPQQLELPVKVEETKTETSVDVYPDSSEFKHGKFLSYCVKSENLVTKAEQLDYPVKPETPETKAEDLSLPMKPESLDCKPEVLQFAAYSDGAEIKSEAKPVALRFAAYTDGAKLKTGAEPEDLRLTAFPDTSAIKPEAKPEALEFPTYPDSSEIKPQAKPDHLEFTALPQVKAEAKRELLEADSTVLTPKLEQADGLLDVSESLGGKGPVKEERPATPVAVVEGYVGSPRFAAPISMCEIPDSLHDTREPTIAQLLQEKALYSFSEWPKDRVIINRLDSICHAILKGKWPSSSEQYDSPGSLVANSCLANSLAQQQHRASFLPTTASSSVPVQARAQQTNLGLGFSIPPPLTRLPKYMSRGGACGRGAWRLNSLPLLQERLVAPPYLPELKRAGGRRSFDYEAAAAAAAAKVLAGKSACHTAATTSSGGTTPVVAPPSHRTGAAMLINGWQETAIDLTKSSGEISTTSGIGTGEGISHHGAGSCHKLPPPPPPITAPLQGSVGMDMAGILQAGLIHPVTGQIVNGSLRGDDSLRRRRGRRRNVEALYSEFTKSRGLHLTETQGRLEVISHSSVSSSTSSPSPSPSERPAGPPTPSSSSTPTPTQTPPQPEIVAIDREAASKGLLHGFVERPKQRRHRCKDPTKLDINSLTGEERVPVVHRGTGRRLGGAMAPAIKELSRWLDANSEYYVAPDWADVVKHSGFLPEGKFSRILTEPVNRDVGSRRRGRRPRSEMPKPLLSVSDSASSGLGPPLFMNGGLIGSMDSMVAMQNLRGAIPGIPISGIMAAGFPHGFSAAIQAGGAGEDAKNGLSMLPMMLHGIPHPHGAGIPQHALFSVGAMMAHTPPPPPHPSSSSSSSSLSAAKVTTTTAPSTSEAASPSSTTSAERERAACSGSGGGEKEPGPEEKGATEANKRGAEAAAVITSTSRAHGGAVHLGAGTGSHLTFNPFLIPGMSHGLLYPHMFLPHGGIMALPAMPPGPGDGSPGSPKRRKKREKEEEREKAATGKGEERESTVKANVSSSSPPVPPSTSAPDPGPCATEDDGPAEPQEPDSHIPPEGVAAEETEERLKDNGGGATEEEKRDSEEQRQAEGEEA